MAEHRIGALPVVQNDKLVGILSATDILRVFAKLERAHEKHLHPVAERKVAHG